jgi:hypothetical protein
MLKKGSQKFFLMQVKFFLGVGNILDFYMLLIVWQLVFLIQNVLPTPRPSLRSGLVQRHVCAAVLGSYMVQFDYSLV